MNNKQKSELDAFMGYAYERHGYPEPEEAKSWSYKQKAVFHAKCNAYEIDPYDRWREQCMVNQAEKELFDNNSKQETLCGNPHNNAEETCLECEVIKHNI